MKHRILLLTALSLSGCTVGSDYSKPEFALPDSWFSSSVDNSPVVKISEDAKAQNEKQWWKNFADPVLDQLIEQATSSNFDLKIAEARIAGARAARGTVESNLLPTVNTVAGGHRDANRFAYGNTSPAGIEKPFNTFQAGFDATWELDVFGGNKRAVEASEAELAAATYTRDDVMISVLAEVAKNYIDVREYQAQLAILNDTLKTEKTTVSIADERYKQGQNSKLDLTQARSQQSQLETQIPYYQNLQAQAEYSIDVLLGKQAGSTHQLLDVSKPVPLFKQEVILGYPSAVIANRADVKIAEQKLVAATAGQGVALAKFFPDISLSGFVGVLNVNSSELLQGGSKSWTLGGNILSPILNYGRLSANLDAADAKQQEALAMYQKSMLSTLSDVAKAVTAYQKQEEFRVAAEKTVKDNQETISIANQRYKQGLSSFIDVLDAERTLYNSQNQLVTAKAKAAQNLVALYKSLGGGLQDTK